jgi:hypothetical protein
MNHGLHDHHERGFFTTGTVGGRARRLAVGAAALSLAVTMGACSKSETTSESGPTTSGTAKAGTTVAPGTTQVSGVQVSDPWARTSPMNATAGAVYMKLRSPVDDKLIGASVASSIAAKVELHETVMAGEGEGGSAGEAKGMPEMGSGASTTSTAAMSGIVAHDDDSPTTMAGGMGDGNGGMMTMKPVESIELPANTEVVLKPGGLHIMLIDLVEPLKVGSSFELTLRFEKAGTMTVSVPVREG